jgi:hypothetical protein
MATKTTRYFTVIAILMTTLSLFSPFSAMASSGETTTSSSSTNTTTIVTNQDASSENGTRSIIDKTQDLTQIGWRNCRRNRRKRSANMGGKPGHNTAGK